MRLVLLAGAAAVLSLIAADAASARERLSRECRREVVRLCGIKKSKIQSCLVEKRDQLSGKCTAQLTEVLRERLSDRQNVRQAEGSATASETISYGNDSLQQLDFYSASRPNAPLVLFVHGGGWKRGDKNNATGPYKAAH